MNTVAQLVTGGLAGTLLALLSVGGLFAALLPWTRGDTHPARLAASTVIRLGLIALGLAALLALGRPAFLAGTLALVAGRPVLVWWLAPRLEQLERGPAP